MSVARSRTLEATGTCASLRIGKRFLRIPALCMDARVLWEAGCRERPPTALGRPARRKYAILLAVALLFAQFVLIAHQIDHQSHESHASKTLCHLCLTAQHLGSTPISKDNPPAIVHGQDSIAFSAVVGLLSSRIITGFFARAPPFFLHA